MAETVIRIEHLSKVYKGDLGRSPSLGLEDLNLEIMRGEVVAFLGPNGAGKTTTIKLLTRLLVPTQGSITILNRPNTTRKSMESVGYMPEQPNLYGYLTGEEFLGFIARLFGLDAGTRKRRTAELLERVGLRDRGKQLIRAYSRGMVQRLAMAQALINDPAVLILDEPMSALDPIGRKEFRDLIFDLKKRQKTIFFSSHILSDAEMISDRVGILKGGRLIKTGKPDDLAGEQVHSIEVTFTLEPGAPALALAQMGIPDAVVQDKNVLVCLNREEDLPGLIRGIESHRGKLVSVIPVKKSLEDLFLAEIGR
jgi:ABC-2 type transport system ATP-binding protein